MKESVRIDSQLALRNIESSMSVEEYHLSEQIKITCLAIMDGKESAALNIAQTISRYRNDSESTPEKTTSLTY